MKVEGIATSGNSQRLDCGKGRKKKRTVVVIIFLFLCVFVILNPAPSPRNYWKLYYLILAFIFVAGCRLIYGRKPEAQKDGLYDTEYDVQRKITPKTTSEEVKPDRQKKLVVWLLSPIVFGVIGLILGFPIAGIYVLGFILIGACFGSFIGIIASISWLLQKFNMPVGIMSLFFNVLLFYLIGCKIHLF